MTDKYTNDLGKQVMAADAEEKRVERWHATYNAALTGLHAFYGGDGHCFDVSAAHASATSAADLAHGKLP